MTSGGSAASAPPAPAPAPGHFADRLIEAMERCGAPACIGLDPVIEKLPAALAPSQAGARAAAQAIEAFCLGVLDAVAGVARVVKAQSACFDRYGAEGAGALKRTIDAARERGFITILDAKRGDIGVTAEHYAAAAFDRERGMGADALTVNASLGFDTVAPYLTDQWRGRGVFVLVRTSNPGSDVTQSARLEGGRTIAEAMADGVAAAGEGRIGARGYSDVGAVVAATKPRDAEALRARMPRQMLLAPGFGAQGGTIETVRALFQGDPAGGSRRGGAIVTASRSVLYPEASGGKDWRVAIRDAARRFADEVATLTAGPA